MPKPPRSLVGWISLAGLIAILAGMLIPGVTGYSAELDQTVPTARPRTATPTITPTAPTATQPPTATQSGGGGNQPSPTNTPTRPPVLPSATSNAGYPAPGSSPTTAATLALYPGPGGSPTALNEATQDSYPGPESSASPSSSPTRGASATPVEPTDTPEPDPQVDGGLPAWAWIGGGLVLIGLGFGGWLALRRNASG